MLDQELINLSQKKDADNVRAFQASGNKQAIYLQINGIPKGLYIFF